MNRRFTGGHMLMLMAAFFGTVVAVNLAMAMAATRTFGGTVVDNSYVASQRFNGWLEQAREQGALGWHGAVTLDHDRHVVVSLVKDGRPLAGAELGAVARHPVGREADAELRFAGSGDGTYRSTRPLPAGRWLVHLEIRRDGSTMRLVENLS